MAVAEKKGQTVTEEAMDFNKSNKDKKKGKNQTAQSLLCCKMFISESRNSRALDSIEQACRRDQETVIVSKFEDREYNRVRYTFVSYVVRDASTGRAIYSPLHETVLAMAEAAYAAIDLESHSGTYPRLGVVDEVLFHPLARATLDEAAWLAKDVAAHIATRFQVPVYLYAAAHPTGKPLDTIRRELGYYTGTRWTGSTTPETLPLTPNHGPSQASRSRGLCTIGARPWVGLYNVAIMSTDVTAARRIARSVSARGGGLPAVQTLGLVHGEDSTEIACMLLEPNVVGAERVQSRVQALAAREGLAVDKGYFTDFEPEMILEMYMKFTSGL